MTVPALAAWRLGCSLCLGAALGLFYGFLRPVKHRLPGDLLFLAVGFWVWLYLGFALCQGDLRLGATLGLVTGAAAWDWSFGRTLAPVFAKFWALAGKIRRFFLVPVKKFLFFYS